MDIIKQKFSRSLMSYITLSLVSILAVAVLSIFISFWVTELADNDAHAINLSGSMRMQAYRIGMALQRDDQISADAYIKILDQTWNHVLFSSQRLRNNQDILSNKFNIAHQHWEQRLRPTLQQGLVDYSLIEQQVALTDYVVNQFQLDAENKSRQLRTLQLLSLLASILVGSLIFYLLKDRVEKPLSQLTQAAYNIGEGNFSQRVDISGQDELGLLGSVFNQMSASIENAYNELEYRVESRTQELNHKNVSLEFLFNTAGKIIDNQARNLDHQQLVDDLASVLKIDTLELCLFTQKGEKPYLHIAQDHNDTTDCSKKSCSDCKGQAPFSKLHTLRISERYPIVLDAHQYGVISVTTDIDTPLDMWQKQLLQSCAVQLAISLSLAEQESHSHRLAMLSERTVIARELHDSLAQALSYLQIQVTRIQKSHDKERWDLQQPIIDELREGLSSAYRQLRELLTTFRLKIDNDGLKGALENTVKQLQERTNMVVSLDYQLSDLPLTPSEEIHLLQIVREASQNATHHSQGKKVVIKLEQLTDKSLAVTITDDGIGIKENSEKLNHYGLAIMTERSNHLAGTISITPGDKCGTQVALIFEPEFRRQTT